MTTNLSTKKQSASQLLVSGDYKPFISHGRTNSVKSVAFSPDETMALSGSDDRTLKLWDITTGKEIVSMVAFRDGEWVAITPKGYFNHSKNGRKHINLFISPMTLALEEDEAYMRFYRPNGVLQKR